MQAGVRRVAVLAAVVAAAMAGLVSWANSDPPPTPAEHLTGVLEAKSLFSQGRYAEAAAAAARLTRENPGNGDLWYVQALANEQAGDARAAVQAYERLGELKFTLWKEALAAARLYAGSLHDKANALRWLKIALYRHRMPGRAQLQTDPAFASLANDPRFKQLAGIPLKPERSRVGKWRADVDFVVSEAQRLHVSIEQEAFSEEFLGAARDLKRRVPRLSDTEIYLELTKLLVLLNDGHTQLLGPGGFNWFSTGRAVQIDLWEFSDGYHIINGVGTAREHVGARVLKVGGVPFDRLVGKVDPYTSKDNEQSLVWKARVRLSLPEVLWKLGALGDPKATSARYTIRDRDGTIKDIDVPIGNGVRQQKLIPSLISSNPAPLYLQRTNHFLWATPVPELDGVWFQYNQVANDPFRPITQPQMADELQAMTEETGARNLIVDVRRNNGGSIGGGSSILLQAIAAFRREDPDNRVFVVVGRNSYSATALWLGMLEELVPDTIFVGELAAAGPNFTGEEGAANIMPYSKIGFNISYKWHGTNPGQATSDLRPYIPMDMPVELSSEQYFNNIDPVYDAIKDFVD